jgi:hypothetical protein
MTRRAPLRRFAAAVTVGRWKARPFGIAAVQMAD